VDGKGGCTAVTAKNGHSLCGHAPSVLKDPSIERSRDGYWEAFVARMVDLINLLIALVVMGPILWSEWRCKGFDILRFLRKYFVRKTQMTDNPIPLLGPLDVAEVFSGRAVGLRRMANLVLATIVAVIVVGIFVFSWAYTLSNNTGSSVFGELTNRLNELHGRISDDFKTMGVAATSLIRTLEAGGCGTMRGGDTPWLVWINDEEIASDFGEKTLTQITNDNFKLYILVRSQWISSKEAPKTTPTETLYVTKNEVGKCVEVFKTATSAKEIAKDVRLANLHIAEYASTSRVMEAAYGGENKTTLAKIEDYFDTQSKYSLIHTNVTRIGSLVMIIFLVTILAPLYRYCLRLAAFYDARSDAVLLQYAKVSTAPFEEVAASTTPMLDFGSPPKTPIDQLIALVRELRGKDKGDKTKEEKEE
jgi:hypothetical protein